MWGKIKSIPISGKILIGMLLGIAAGIIFRDSMGEFEFIGVMWMNALKIAIAPMVVVMLILGIGKQENPKRMGRVSLQLVVYYTFTTFAASILAILVAKLTKAGIGFKMTETAADMEAVEMTFSKFFLSLIPDNFLAPLVNSNLMQVLVLGVICGLVVLRMKDTEIKNSIIHGCECLQEMLNGILRLALGAAPVGIFFYMASIVGTNGAEVLRSLGKFMATLLAADVIQITVVYGLIVMLLLSHKNPLIYWKNMLPSWIIAFTTASSVLVIPTNTEICTKKYDVDPAIANFGIPLGAVFNFDGAAIFFPCVIVFAAQACGISYSFGMLLYMSVICTLITSSGGGVFGGALIKLMVMCQLFNVPNAIVTMVAGVFAVIDMFITVVNISGDTAGTIFVDTLDKRRRIKTK